MSAEYTIVIEKDEDGYYVGSVPALPGCHTQGSSIDQLLERMQEAITLWLEVEGEDAPRPLETGRCTKNLGMTRLPHYAGK